MSEGEKETWNMATATLQRFDLILKHSSMYAQMGLLAEWKRCLMDLRRNLFPFMTPDEFTKANEKFNSLPKGWELPNNKVTPKHFSEVNKIFDEIYMQFISIMKKKGLLMPKPVDSGKAIIEM
tara:strand:- start:368 stop:736 length:369 start_codon:yes stop_codon:yes gene_type:complete